MIADALPDLPFVTVIDAFLLACFSWIGAVSIQNIFSARMGADADTLCAYIFLGTYGAAVLLTLIGMLSFHRLQSAHFQRYIETAMSRRKPLSVKSQHGHGRSEDVLFFEAAN